jgi:hypothetical protein
VVPIILRGHGGRYYIDVSANSEIFKSCLDLIAVNRSIIYGKTVFGPTRAIRVEVCRLVDRCLNEKY